MAPYRLVGYFPSSAIHAQNYTVADIPADRLTHVIYAFAQLNSDGTCVSINPDDDGINLPQLQKLKQQHPSLQTLISVGGASHSTNFSSTAATDAGRQHCAQSCVQFMKQDGFDGIDIDWEFPAAADSQNFTALLTELRRQLEAAGAADKRKYLLTIAAPAGSDHYANLQLELIHPQVDWIGLMAYDFAVASSGDTDFVAPLRAYDTSLAKHATSNVAAAVQAYLKAGVPPGKLVLGTRFVGTGWQGVASANNGLYQTDKGPAKGTWDAAGAAPTGSFGYGDLARNHVRDTTRFWHADAEVPWLFDPDTGIMISYDDPLSLGRKAALVVANGLAGAMIWNLSADDGQHTLLNSLADGLAAPDTLATYNVSGTVSSSVSVGVGRLLVELVDKNVGPDVPLGITTTDAAGRYSLSLGISSATLASRSKTRPDLQARVSAGRTFLAASAVSYNAPAKVTLDVGLPDTASGLPSEYETLTASIGELYRGALSELQETAQQQDLSFLANKTGWDARAVAMAALAEQFSRTMTAPAGSASAVPGAPAGPGPAATPGGGPSASTTIGLQPAFYYALFRSGVPANADQLFRTSPARAAAIWTQAISQGVIPASLEQAIPAATQAFQALAASHVLIMTPRVGLSTLATQLSSVLTSAGQQSQFAALLVQYAGNWSAFWTAAQTAFGQETADQLRGLGRLHYLTLNNTPLVAALLKAVPSVTSSPQDLASGGFYDPTKWTPLIGDAIPPGVPGTTPAEQAANYAAFLAAQVKLALPTAVLSDQVSRGVMPIAAPSSVAQEVSRFLSANQDAFQIGAEPVEAFIARTKVAAPSAEALGQIKRLQRVYQLTTSDESMAVLLRHNLDSAYAITRYDPAGFVRAHGPQLGGADAAAQVHKRARQVHGAVLNLAVSYGVAVRSPGIGGTLGIIDNPRRWLPPSVPPAATLEQLFGSLDYCNCSDCNSILSPAAYFVDLLRYLDQPAPTPGFANPQDALFLRRPDLQYLALSCENTDTALPYIDIVNETLEAFVAGNLSLDGYEGFNTSPDVTSAELMAAPQNVNDAAYAALRASFYPAPLPFNRPLELLRRHMQALNVALPDAMIALRASDAVTSAPAAPPTSYAWSDILIEQLGISRDEYRIFTDPTRQLGDLYGLPRALGQTDAQWNAATLSTLQQMNLQDFSRRTGVGYADLVAILKTRFINPGSALIERVEVLGVGFAAIQQLHSNPFNAAAFVATLPAGLDYSQYGGTDGQAVVTWLGQNYGTIMGLITIANPGGGQDDCSGTALQFRYAKPDPLANMLTAMDFLKLIRFIRLWSKLQALLQISDDGGAIQATDALLCALYPAAKLPVNSGDPANDATNRPLLDAGFGTALARAGFLIQVLNRLSLDTGSRTRLLACWADIGTNGTDSLYASMFLTPTLLQQDPGAQVATVSPTVNAGDTLTTTIDSVPVVYKVAAGDTPQTVATKIAAKINTTATADPVSGKALNQRFHAAADGAQVVITAGFSIKWSASGSGTLSPAASADPTSQSATVGGTPTPGETFTVTIDTLPVAYVAQAGDTPAAVASALATAINGTTAPHPYSGLPLNTLLAASAEAGAVVTVRTADAGPPFDLVCSIKLAGTGTYTVGAPTPAKAVVALSGSVTAGDVVTLMLNNVAVTYPVAAATDTSLTALAGSLANTINGAVQTDPTTKVPFGQLLHATSRDATLTITPVDPSTSLSVTVSSNGTESFAVNGPAPASQTAIVAGTFPPGAVLTTTINGADLFCTVAAGDTASTIASKIAGQISGISGATVPDPVTGKPLNTLVSASAAGGVVMVAAADTTTAFTLAVSASQGAYTAGRLNPPFADNGYGVYLGDPTGPAAPAQTLFGHQPTLCAACNLTGAEFALITAALGFDATIPLLTLDNVSAVFRYGWLAHALGISVLEFLTLRRFSGLDPFAPLDPSPTPPAEPPVIRFVRLVQRMQSAGLAPVQALYMLWNQDVSGTLAPGFAAVAALAQALRADFAAVEAQFTLKDDPTGAIAQQLMALVYGATDTDFFFGLLNQTFSVSIPYGYASPTLPQPVLDASGGLLAYDDTAKTLSVHGLLTDSGASGATAIAAAAQVSTHDSTDNLAAPGLVTLTPASMANIAPGAALVIDSGPAAQETVVVASVTATSFTTTTAHAHNGTSTPFPIVNDPSLPEAVAALAAASQQAVAPFFAKHPELASLYTAYVASTAPVQTRRKALLASFLPTLIRLRKAEQALAEITAQIGCDPGFAPALLQDAVILHSDADPTQPAVADLTGIEAGGLTAALFLGNDPTKPPDQATPAVGPVAYAQTATLGGTPVAGAVLTTTINGQPVTSPAAAADTSLDALAGQMAAAINACTTVDPASKLPINRLVTASASGAVVTISPTQPLAATGVFTLACTSSAAGLIYTAGSQLPAGKGGAIAGSWSGYIAPPQTGNYDFCVVADPGATVRLEIDGADVPMALASGVFSNQAEISLNAGQLTPITLAVSSLKTTLALGWRGPPGPGWTLIPAAALFPAAAMESLGATYVRFLKAVSLASALSLTAAEIAWLGTDTTQAVETTCAIATAPGTATFTPASMTNIEVGAKLVIDTGPAQETVTVASKSAAGTSFTAVTAQAHNGTPTAFPIVSVPQPVLNRGWLNSLPGRPDADPVNHPTPDLATAAQLTPVLAAVLDFARLKKALSPGDERVLNVLQAPGAVLPSGQGALLSLTGWAQVSVDALCARFFGDSSPDHLASVENLARVNDAMTLVRACRVTAPALLSAVTNAPTPTTVSGLQSALRARYAASDWATVIKPINDAMRRSQRDALVAWILQGLTAEPGNTIRTADDLYAWFLIDPSTEPAVQTSRIRLALSAVQLFVESVVHALEQEISPGASVPQQWKVSPGDINLQQWEWMKRYRVWQANREVFLWPENWLYPQLRDDQSPIFQQVVSALLQSDITDDAATSAYLDYLSGLADVAKLEPCGMYYVPGDADTDEVTYVVARSFGAHRKYYFRQLQGGSWSPWTEVKIDCEDMPITPIAWNNRLFLFWLKVHKQSLPPTQPPQTARDNTTIQDPLGKILEAVPSVDPMQVVVQATLWWTEYYNGKWQSPKSSDPNRPTTIGTFDPSGPGSFEAYRNQVRIVPAKCTGAYANNPLHLQFWNLPTISPDALILAILTPTNPFPTFSLSIPQNGPGFLLHNTHSAPTPLDDVTATASFIFVFRASIGLLLDVPVPSRTIEPPDNPYQTTPPPYSAGPSSGSLVVSYFSTYDEFWDHPNFRVQILGYNWLPRIVEVQPGLPDAKTAPFIYEDRRNLFYVTAKVNQYTFRESPGFGSGIGGSTALQSQDQPRIPPVQIAAPNGGSPVTVTLPGVNPITYQETEILTSGGQPKSAPVQTTNAAR